jgi:hypothetical protein
MSGLERTVQMSRLLTLLSIGIMVFTGFLSWQVMAGEVYEELDPSQISCGVKGASFTKSYTADGYEFKGVSVEKLICEGQEIALVRKKFDGDFLSTKDYGKIKITFGRDTLTPSFSMWVTVEQKEALLTTLKSKRRLPKPNK